MIPTKTRENRKIKPLKLSKNLERIYKELDCRECTVVITPMDFAKILGKFTKVKIQYENSSKTKPKQTNVVSPNSRLKAKENGLVQIRRNVYNPHRAEKLHGLKKSKSIAPSTPTSNVLKENNILKKPLKISEDYNYSDKLQIKSKQKQYEIVFVNPACEKEEVSNDISLHDLIPKIDKNILPASDWSIDYLPKSGEPKNDKIYDRIAAELEDLMYNEKTKSGVKDGKNEDEFPSIMDILNENAKDDATKSNNQANTITLESSDVEAMLMGNTNQPSQPTLMEVDKTDVKFLVKTVVQQKPQLGNEGASTIDDNPESPSILEETQNDTSLPKESTEDKSIQPPRVSGTQSQKMDVNDNTNTNNKNDSEKTLITHIVFRKTINGLCRKSVTCPKNLKYSVSILGKPIELVGAPKHLSSLEDLQVLLQIVEESELNNHYVLH